MNPAETMVVGEDNFDRIGGPGAFVDLEGGVAAVLTPNYGFWDGHFPDAAEAAETPTVPPSTPGGVAALALRLEAGLKVTYEWQTDIFKSYDGKEMRAALLDDPRESYDGNALLTGADVLSTRGALATHAANGAIFSLALPYEATTIGAVNGSDLSLQGATTSLDWAVTGQRVLILRGAGGDLDTATAVIQSVAASGILVDDLTGLDAVVEGAVVMPLVPVLLEPEQHFGRYRSGSERWQLTARAAGFGFPISAVPGELTKAFTATSATFRAATPGITVAMQLEVLAIGAIVLSVTPGTGGDFNLFVQVPIGTTLEQLNTALAGSGLIVMLGSFNPAAVILGPQGFALTTFIGAIEAGYSEMGAGGVVTQLLGRPLWDRKLENPSTITDSIHTMTDRVDLGGVPLGVVEAEIPDWGRHLRYTSNDWQWFKAFMAAVKGRWKSFYLPTGRTDLIAMANATAATLLVDATQGDYEMWVARGYSVLEVVQGGVSRFVQATSSSEAGGVLTLGVTGVALVAAAVERISWCELVRLERDEIEVTWDASKNFNVALTARVVQQ